jgi:hypothetical protein
MEAAAIKIISPNKALTSILDKCFDARQSTGGTPPDGSDEQMFGAK